MLGIFLKQKFVECSSNILQILLCDCWNLPKDQHLFLSNHTFLTHKQLFHREFIKNYFPLKCSLNVPWMSETLQRWGNTQRTFLEYCVPAEQSPGHKDLLKDSCNSVKSLCSRSSILTITYFFLNKILKWPVWLNVWVVVYELSGYGFESRCCHLRFKCFSL